MITNNAAITTGGVAINAYSETGDVTVFNDSALTSHGVTVRPLSGGTYAVSKSGNVTIAGPPTSQRIKG